MSGLLKNTAQSAIIGFAAGALLALVLPAAFSVMGMAGTAGYMANPLWLGTFSGLFGAVTAVCTAAYQSVVGKPEEAPPACTNTPQTRMTIRIINPEREPAFHEAQSVKPHVEALIRAREAAQPSPRIDL